eukprot:6213414-Pleurochrysis_carterae.AAC.11
MSRVCLSTSCNQSPMGWLWVGAAVRQSRPCELYGDTWGAERERSASTHAMRWESMHASVEQWRVEAIAVARTKKCLEAPSLSDGGPSQQVHSGEAFKDEGARPLLLACKGRRATAPPRYARARACSLGL